MEEKLSYRKKEIPTGEEANSIVKFNRIVILNGIEMQTQRIVEKIKKANRITAALTAVNAAVVVAVILAERRYLK